MNYYNPYMNTTPMPYVPTRHGITRVNGENGAKSFQMGANDEVLLLDETAPIIWLKTTDGGGYPTLTPYSISLYEPKPEVNLNDLEARIERLEGLINGKSNAKSIVAEKPESSTNKRNKADADAR